MNSDGKGYISVNVRYANGAAPIENGKIVINDGTADRTEYITDGAGKSQIKELDASEEYRLKINADGFEEQEYGNIRIYPGRITVIDAVLFPAVKRSEGDM